MSESTEAKATETEAAETESTENKYTETVTTGTVSSSSASTNNDSDDETWACTFCSEVNYQSMMRCSQCQKRKPRKTQQFRQIAVTPTPKRGRGRRQRVRSNTSLTTPAATTSTTPRQKSTKRGRKAHTPNATATSTETKSAVDTSHQGPEQPRRRTPRQKRKRHSSKDQSLPRGTDGCNVMLMTIVLVVAWDDARLVWKRELSCTYSTSIILPFLSAPRKDETRGKMQEEYPQSTVKSLA